MNVSQLYTQATLRNSRGFDVADVSDICEDLVETLEDAGLPLRQILRHWPTPEHWGEAIDPKESKS